MNNDLIEQKVRRWQRNLINLGLRNKLLNFKVSSTKSVKEQHTTESEPSGNELITQKKRTYSSNATKLAIVDELPREIFRLLQLDNKAMTFLPALNEPALPTQQMNPRQMAASNQPLESKYIDTKLQTNLPLEKLGPALLRIHQRANTMIEEQGINCLGLSLGILQWYEDENSDKALRAPLVILPVELIRRGATHDFSLKTTSEDPIVNPALSEKLRLDFRIKLPDWSESFEDFDADAYFSKVEEAISKQERWNVSPEIFLDIFSFAKYPMYKEIESNLDAYLTNNKIIELCTGSQTALSMNDDLASVDLDQHLAPEDHYQILDADSSQQRAVLAAKRNLDLVIEGPPGTGKSQTIANIIADALGDGKTVLFVSEKMAALNVVYDRLATCGLRDFCLRLHSQDATKRAVYAELSRTLSTPDEIVERPPLDKDGLKQLRSHLNNFVKEMHKPATKTGATLFSAIGNLERLKTAIRVSTSLKNVPDIDHVEFSKLRALIKDLVAVYATVGPPSQHPWNGSTLEQFDLDLEMALETAVKEAIDLLNELRDAASELSETLGASKPKRLGDFEILGEVQRALINSPGTSKSILLSESWNNMPPIVEMLIKHGKQYRATLMSYQSIFRVDTIDHNLAPMTKRYAALTCTWTRFARPEFWSLRKKLQKMRQDPKSKLSDELTLSALNSGVEALSHCAFLEKQSLVAEQLFGQHWRGIDTNWEKLDQFADWMVSIRKLIISDALQPEGLTRAAEGHCQDADSSQNAEHIAQALSKLRSTLVQLFAIAKFDATVMIIADAKSPIEELRLWLTNLKDNLAGLKDWCLFHETRSRVKNTKIETFVDEYLFKGHSSSALEESWLATYYRSLINECLRSLPHVKLFQLERHERRLAEFQMLDRSLKDHAQRLLQSLLSNRRHILIHSPELQTQLMAVQRELRKKARQAPVRRLLSETASVLKAIKPCFMMSPLSVAQFLKPSVHTFDVVVFDEASQITPEDALGSIIRGRQVIVVGDPKQLPPTNFFNQQSNFAAVEDGDDDVSDGVESILDEFASRGFPYRRLLWHYRSKHESLNCSRRIRLIRPRHAEQSRRTYGR